MKISVVPDVGLIDEVSSFTVAGVEAGSFVELTLKVSDRNGFHWSSSDSYEVGSRGELILPDADRPWWNMAFQDVQASVPVLFAPPVDGADYEITAVAGDLRATATARRNWSVDIGQEELTGTGWHLSICYPLVSDGPGPAVLVIPGSMGTRSVTPMAATLASRGYVTAVLVVVGEPGMPASFNQIPIEVVTAGIDAFNGHPRVDPSRLAVMSGSVGTELALTALAASDAPAVKALVLRAPSHVVWQGLSSGGPPPKTSSVTSGGVGLPYVRMRGEKILGQILIRTIRAKLSRRPRSKALTLLEAYRAGLDDTAAVAAATIAVERVRCPIMLIAGGQDLMWPAESMAREIAARRADHHVDGDDRLLVYPDAGHFFGVPATPTTVDRSENLVGGGTPSGAAQAQRHSWTESLAFLAEHLAPRP